MIKVLLDNIPRSDDTKEIIKSLRKANMFVKNHLQNKYPKTDISIRIDAKTKSIGGNNIFDLKKIQKSLPPLSADLPKCNSCYLSFKLYCDNCIFKKCEFLSRHGYDLIQQITYLNAWNLFNEVVKE